MRGSTRKAIRDKCLGYPAYVKAGLTPTYTPEPRTVRRKLYQVPGINDKGERSTVEIAIQTVTYRLAPNCRRFYTQRIKRRYAKEQRV